MSNKRVLCAYIRALIEVENVKLLRRVTEKQVPWVDVFWGLICTENTKEKKRGVGYLFKTGSRRIRGAQEQECSGT